MHQTTACLAKLTVQEGKYSRAPTPIAGILPVPKARDVHPGRRVSSAIREENRTKHVQDVGPTVVCHGLGVYVGWALPKLLTKPPKGHPTATPFLASHNCR